MSEREVALLKKLRKNLSENIEWYHSNINDGDYVYDECHDQFNQMCRGDLQSILELLAIEEV